MKKGCLAFGFLIILGLLSGCNQQAVEEMDTAQFKEFMKNKESGFVVLTHYTNQEEQTRVHLKKAIEEYKQSTKHFNYLKQNTENDPDFLYNNGIEQGTETLAYYKNGVLQEEFNFLREWDSEEIVKLHKFVEEMNRQEP